MGAYSEQVSIWLRAKYSFMGTLIFILVTNPMMLRLLQNVVGGILQNDSITPKGYAIQIFLFFGCTLGLMMFPKDS